MTSSSTGGRIRDVRRRVGISQTALAKAAGISPSYLNLIEHNRRQIGGRVLNAIADALDVRAGDLSEANDPAYVVDLREAAGHADMALEPVEDLMRATPAWAEYTARQHRRIRDQEAAIRALTDRLSNDPLLAETIHGVISNVTAIRSTAAILSEVRTLSPGQLNRFHEGLNDESLRLAVAARNLAEHLETASGDTLSAVGVEETLDRFLADAAYHFPELDRAGEERADPAPLIAARLEAEPDLGPATSTLLADHLRIYAKDARAMPLSAFVEASNELRFDPFALAQQFEQDVLAVFRRLATLHRPNLSVPEFGLVIATASGYPLFRRPLTIFPLPRHGNACPLWPLFRALSAGGAPILARLSHDWGEEFTAIALAAPRHPARLGAAAEQLSAMLFLRAADSPFPPPTAEPLEIGTSCRICSRTACTARVQPALVGS